MFVFISAITNIYQNKQLLVAVPSSTPTCDTTFCLKYDRPYSIVDLRQNRCLRTDVARRVHLNPRLRVLGAVP